jgi:hypothetical protein
VTTTAAARPSRSLLRLLGVLSAVIGLLAGSAGSASASTASRSGSSSRLTHVAGLETRVGVAADLAPVFVGPGRSVSAGQVGEKCPRFLTTVVGSCVATETGTGAKPKGTWVKPEDAAQEDADEIADSHRGDPSYESGRHGEGPRQTARDLGELIKQSEKAGKLPEYVDRLKKIQKTFEDRSRAGHPGGRR